MVCSQALRCNRGRCPPRGFTLLELITTLGLLAILSVIAIPSLFDLLRDTRIRGQVYSLVHAVHFARQQATNRNSEIILCKSPNGSSCNEDAAWELGWLIFENSNQEDPPTLDEDELILLVQEGTSNVSIAANRDAFVLRPGFRRSTNGTFTLCDIRGSKYARSVVISYTGKARVARTTSSGKPIACT